MEIYIVHKIFNLTLIILKLQLVTTTIVNHFGIVSNDTTVLSE